MAVVKYLTQGLDETKSHLNAVKKVVGSEKFDNIIISTAYLREDAVTLLKSELNSNSEKIRAFVGIRNGATSMQALKALFDTGVCIYVIDTGSVSSIFHIKNYIGYNETEAVAITGSANFTPSGLVRNIEGSSIINLDLNTFDDREYLQTVINDIELLINEHQNNVVKLTCMAQIDELLSEGRVVDEKEQSNISKVGTSTGKKMIVPRMKLKFAKMELQRSKDTKIKEGNTDESEVKIENIEAISLSKGILNLIEVWQSKSLVERDLNVPSNSYSTNVTGSMLLKKGKYDVDQQTYFREVVFQDLNWVNKEGKPNYFEYASAEIYFIIEGVEIGKYKVEIKHDTRTDTRTYEQRQPMTHLIWGECREFISNRNLLGKEMTLYKVTNSVAKNEYVINIC